MDRLGISSKKVKAPSGQLVSVVDWPDVQRMREEAIKLVGRKLQRSKKKRWEEARLKELTASLDTAVLAIKNASIAKPEKNTRSRIARRVNELNSLYADSLIPADNVRPDWYFSMSAVYVISLALPTLTVLKVGFSNNLAKRLSDYGLAETVSFDLLGFVEAPDTKTARLLERILHISAVDYRQAPEVAKPYMKNGFTECFSMEAKPVLLDTLRTLTGD